MKKINRSTLKQLLPSIIFVLIGLLFIIFSESITNYIVLILGICVLGYGLYNIFVALYNKKRINPTFNYYKGGIATVIGVLLVLFSKNIANLIMVFAGFYVVLSSLLSIYTAWKLYTPSKERNTRLVFGGVELLIGLILTFLPQSSLSFICIVIGIYLLYKGSTMAIGILFFKQKRNSGFFYSNNTYYEEKNDDPNIIDHDDIKDKDILKK
jgi:uncharacterized membrane protein HdeD (DUF308 family)